MPPFQYQPFVSPYVQSISALLQAPGQIEAQRAQTVGNAQAQAAQASGQAYGNAAQQIGQIPQQMQAQKTAQLQQQDIAAQIKERQAIAADRQRTLETAQAGAAAIQASTGPDGTIDPEKAAGIWSQTHPEAAQAYLASVQKTKQTGLAIQEAQQKLQSAQQAQQQAMVNHAGELGAAGLQMMQSETPINARDHGLALVADALTNKLIDPPTAQQMVMRVASASPDDLKGIYQHFLDAAPAVKSRLVEEDLKKAETAKNLADAQKAGQPQPPKQYEVTVPGPNGQPLRKLVDGSTLQGGVPEYQKPDKGPQPKTQDALEQEYRTVLQRGLSSRSGGLGLEDQKVQTANHLIALMDQGLDAKTGSYNIPAPQLNEMALGLARLVSPNGNVGVELSHELNQRTAKGDVAGVVSYLTGTPVTGNTQDVIKMFRDAILRQGQVAEQNREGEMGYLRGLAPTDLEEPRRQALEKNSLNPLRQSRVATGPNGDRKLVVSLDGGKTWK